MKEPIQVKRRTLLMLAACLAMGASVIAGLAVTAQGATAKQWKLTFVAGDKGDPLYITLNCGAAAEAKKDDASLNMQAPATFSPTDQTPIVNGVAAGKPDALLIAPTDAKAMYTDQAGR